MLAILSAVRYRPPSIAKKVFPGDETALSKSSVAALSHRIDTTFQLFVTCYAIALLFALLLLKRDTSAKEAGTRTRRPQVGFRDVRDRTGFRFALGYFS